MKPRVVALSIMAAATAAFGAALSLNLSPATAASFDFSYTDNSTVTVQGVLTAVLNDPTTMSYQITGISGTRNGVNIDGLLPTGQFNGNDNLLFPNNSNSQLDDTGFSYTVSGTSINVFNSGFFSNSPAYFEFTQASGTTSLATFQATVPPVPEPSEVLAITVVGLWIGAQGLKRRAVSKKAMTSSSLVLKAVTNLTTVVSSPFSQR